MAFPTRPDPQLKPLPRLLFMSRWLQLPLYLGLIVAQAAYVYYFLVEPLRLVEAAFGNVHQRGVVRAEGPDRADRHPHHVPVLGRGDRGRGSHHARAPAAP